MKALTIWQPYAQAIALGLKKYDTRSWATHYRGLIAIHASQKPMNKQLREIAEKYGIVDKLEYGAVIAICEVVDCVQMTPKLIAAQPRAEIDFGDWQVGRYAWKLKLIKVLDKPEQTRGYQGLWNYK